MFHSTHISLNPPPSGEGDRPIFLGAVEGWSGGAIARCRKAHSLEVKHPSAISRIKSGSCHLPRWGRI